MAIQNNLPRLSVPKPAGMPKPIRISAPKIASVHVTPVGKTLSVQHNMTHGPKLKPFVFSDPGKMRQHLARIQNSEWRMPDRNEGPAVDKVLDLDGSGTSSF